MVLRGTLAALVGRVWPRYRYVGLIEEVLPHATRVGNEEQLLDTMDQISMLSEDEQHFQQFMLTLVSHVTESRFHSVLAISNVVEAMALPAQDVAVALTERLVAKMTEGLAADGGAVVAARLDQRFYRVRNTFYVLGMLAERLAGRTAELIFSDSLQQFLVSVLGNSAASAELRLGALLTLEQFSKTSSNKERLLRSEFTQHLGQLATLEATEDAARQLLAATAAHIASPSRSQLSTALGLVKELAFVAQWLLQNNFSPHGAAVPPPPAPELVTLWRSTHAFMELEHATTYIKVSPDGLTVRNDSFSFESIRANACASAVGLWYYEVQVVTAGMMQIGWATTESSFESDDGQGVGDTPESFGYDGFRRLLWNDSNPYVFGPRRQWRPNDIISAFLDLDSNQMWFAVNGAKMYQAPFFLNNVFRERLFLYPAVSLTHQQQVRFNFGREPFAFPPPPGPDGRAMRLFNDQPLPEPFPEVHLRNLCPRRVLPQPSSQSSSLVSSALTSPSASTDQLPQLAGTVELVVDSVSGHLQPPAAPRSGSSRAKKCMICFATRADTRLEPCQHDGLCYECSLRVEICPLCRTPISVRQQLKPAPRAVSVLRVSSGDLGSGKVSSHDDAGTPLVSVSDPSEPAVPPL